MPFIAKKNMNNQKIKRFIKEKKYLFWWIKEEDIENISIELLTEAILSYGNESDIKKLFNLIGIERVAKIFKMQISRKRINYQPRTVNFFRLYFNRNA